jgi:hypothetical protein
MTINEYVGKLPIEIEAEILNLVDECKITEPYDTSCDLTYTWSTDGEIVAVMAFKLYNFADGRTLPRIQHVIFHPDYASKKKARSSFAFLRRVFVMVGEKGYPSIWAYIQPVPVEEYMKKMAIKLGFTVYSKDNEGEYLSLNLK